MTREKAMSVMTKLTRRVNSNVQASSGLTNTTVDKFCRLVCSSDFKGVYSADYIPLKMAARTTFIIVVNLGLRKGVRTELPLGHFVTLVATASDIYYIDPYGFPSAVPHVNRFLRLCRRNVCFNFKQIQHFKSVYCGMYAILFACYMDKANNQGNKFKLKFKSKNLLQNDNLCVKYMRQLIATM
jgi:hypothetical protein